MTEQPAPRDPTNAVTFTSGPDRIATGPQERPFSSSDPIREPWTRGPSLPEARPEAPPPAPQSPISSFAADPVAAAFGEFARSAGLPSDLVSETSAWWEETGQQHYEFAARDSADRAAVEADLRRIWQGRYEENMQTVRAYLDSGHLAPGVADVLFDGRRADGTAVLNQSATIVQLFGAAQRAGPPLPKIDPRDIDGTIRQLEGYMRRDRKRYDADGPAQARLRAAYAAREARKTRE